MCTSTNIVKQMIENLHAHVQVGLKILLALGEKYMHLCKCALVKSITAAPPPKKKKDHGYTNPARVDSCFSQFHAFARTATCSHF